MVNQKEGSFPHVKWLDLKANGVMVECAILKEDGAGNIYFIEIPSLDSFDKTRLVKIITNRNAQSFELWDLMSQVTLNNGVNALTYFHQLVKVITPLGVIMNPRQGHIGTGKVQADAPVAPQAPAPVAAAPVAPNAPLSENAFNQPVQAPPAAAKAATKKTAARKAPAK